MFDTSDRNLITKIINTKTNDQLVIPLYIKMGNKYYSILEMNDISDFSPFDFKLGFGTCTSVFTKNNYIKTHLTDYQNYNIFNIYDDNKQLYINYFTFESGVIENSQSEFNKQINNWLDIISNHLNQITSKKRKDLIDKMIHDNENNYI